MLACTWQDLLVSVAPFLLFVFLGTADFTHCFDGLIFTISMPASDKAVSTVHSLCRACWICVNLVNCEARDQHSDCGYSQLAQSVHTYLLYLQLAMPQKKAETESQVTPNSKSKAKAKIEPKFKDKAQSEHLGPKAKKVKTDDDTFLVLSHQRSILSHIRQSTPSTVPASSQGLGSVLPTAPASAREAPAAGSKAAESALDRSVPFSPNMPIATQEYVDAIEKAPFTYDDADMAEPTGEPSPRRPRTPKGHPEEPTETAAQARPTLQAPGTPEWPPEAAKAPTTLQHQNLN